MPPKPYFVTTEELSNLRGKHQIMSEEVRQWLQTETNRVNNTTQYRIQGRSSMDDALRLFLIADKNFSLEAALDLNISPEEMKQYYEEFFQTYTDPDKSPEENLYLIGGMHRRALEKIQEYRFRDYSNVKSVEDFINVHTFFELLSGLMTSLQQDTQFSNPDYRLAYYAGAGGKNNLNKLTHPIEMAYSQMNSVLPYLDHPEIDYPVDTKAQYLKLCRNQILRYSNQKISDIQLPVFIANDAMNRIAIKTDLMKNEEKGYPFPQDDMVEVLGYVQNLKKGKLANKMRRKTFFAIMKLNDFLQVHG
ncbi:MAG: hypothetical protein IKN79_08100 [Eubacterium sp.]|nr:hypothetical protein [Eubacterium sp.]